MQPINVSPGKNDSQSEHDPNALSVQQAIDHIQTSIHPVSETLSVDIKSAFNHVLAEDVTSPLNVPPYRNSAMDGYAILSSDIPQSGSASLKVVGTSWAGTPYAGELNAGECIRIMTGAKMPDVADTVIMQEHAERSEDNIKIATGHCAGQNVRHIGEDIKQGNVVLTAGTHIKAAQMGLLASLGVAKVKVFRPLRICFFSTGDELKPLGSKLEEGQIYDSNRYTLHGMLAPLNVEIIDLGVIVDDKDKIRQAFLDRANQADVLITSGGVSVGDADYVKEILTELGQVNFWKISMKPGRPLAFGQVNKAFFFGLPGNPVSVMATFYEFALAGIYKMMGMRTHPVVTVRARCTHNLKKRPGRTDFQRGVLSHNENGELIVSATGMQASHILSGMSEANCFIVLPAESGNIEAESMVDVQPFYGLMP